MASCGLIETKRRGFVNLGFNGEAGETSEDPERESLRGNIQMSP